MLSIEILYIIAAMLILFIIFIGIFLYNNSSSDDVEKFADKVTKKKTQPAKTKLNEYETFIVDAIVSNETEDKIIDYIKKNNDKLTKESFTNIIETLKLEDIKMSKKNSK